MTAPECVATSSKRKSDFAFLSNSGYSTVSRLWRCRATAGLRWLTEVANEVGVTLVLHADPWGTREGMPREVLKTWYERYGFAARSNRLVLYWHGRLGLTMCREPR